MLSTPIYSNDRDTDFSRTFLYSTNDDHDDNCPFLRSIICYRPAAYHYMYVINEEKNDQAGILRVLPALRIC